MLIADDETLTLPSLAGRFEKSSRYTADASSRSDIVLAGGVETMDRVQPIAPGDERNLGRRLQRVDGFDIGLAGPGL